MPPTVGLAMAGEPYKNKNSAKRCKTESARGQVIGYSDRCVASFLASPRGQSDTVLRSHVTTSPSNLIYSRYTSKTFIQLSVDFSGKESQAVEVVAFARMESTNTVPMVL
jgi:hypothetical protein